MKKLTILAGFMLLMTTALTAQSSATASTEPAKTEKKSCAKSCTGASSETAEAGKKSCCAKKASCTKKEEAIKEEEK